jgi:dihydrofolate reductase
MTTDQIQRLELIIIAAIAKNNAIGQNGQMPWPNNEYKEDMKRFKELTTGNPVIMGRLTYESIPKRFRPLPKRQNIILSRNPNYDSHPDVKVEGSIQKVIFELAKVQTPKAYVMGGAAIYKLAMPLADTLQITHIKKPYEADTFFPEINMDLWKIENEEQCVEDNRLTFVTYTKR